MCQKWAGFWWMTSDLLQTSYNVKVTGVCRTLFQPCGIGFGGFFCLVCSCVRISCGLLSLLLFSIHTIETVTSFMDKIRFIWEDLKAKKTQQTTWWTNYPVISVSEMQLLDHWILQHLDLRKIKQIRPSQSFCLTLMWWFEAFSSLLWFFYGLLPWKESVLRSIKVVSRFCPQHFV